MQARRVLVLSHTAQLGGGERALLRLLDALEPGRFAVSVITFEDGDLVGELQSRGIPVEVVPLGALNGLTRHEPMALGILTRGRDAAGFCFRLARAAAEHRPELLVANSLKSALFAAVTAPRLGRPWVWHLHDRLAPGYMPARTAAVLRRLAAALPRHVVVNSRATLETLGAVPRHKVSIAYPGLEREVLAPPAEPSQRAQVRDLVGTLARISATKGQREFVQAAQYLAHSHPSARFRIVGAALFQDGDYERDLHDLVRESDLAERVELTGWTSRPAEDLGRFGVFVHVPPVPEPFGQVVVEAMAARIPVIGADDGGIREILDEGDGRDVLAEGVERTRLGILVRPGDPAALAAAIAWALDHPAELAAMTDDAAESVRKRFAISETAHVVSRVWNSALPDSSARLDPIR